MLNRLERYIQDEQNETDNQPGPILALCAVDQSR